MKKTLTINLNNTVFHIDDDAYELLQSYLAEVGHHFKSETEKADIMNDIEARIAELFSEKMQGNKNVITIDDVNDIIEVMGKPNQFADVETDEESDQTETKKTASHSKKFYRDTEHQLLGGVAAGLAAYLNLDVTLVRAILIILVVFTSGYIIPIYLVMWLIAPKAETTAQKLEMRGEDVNIETIKNKMNDAKEYLESDKFKNSATDIGTKTFDVFKSIFRVIFTIIGSILSVVGVILAAVLIFGMIIFLLEPDAITGISPEFFAMWGDISPEKIVLMVIGLLLIISCPIFALIYWNIRANSKDKPKSYTGLWVALVLWLAGIFMFLSVGADTFKKLNRVNYWSDQSYNEYDSENPNHASETRTVEPFHAIDASGVVNVVLTQQQNQNLVVTSLKEYLPNIKTEVLNGVLKIYSTDNLIKPSIRVQIGIDSLTDIMARGASNVKFETPFTVKRLNFDLQGASKVNLDIKSAQKLNIQLAGASKLDAKGDADSLDIEASGATLINSDDLHTKVVKINLSGASKADVYASESFDGKAYGASRINCAGNPPVKSNESNVGASISYK